MACAPAVWDLDDSAPMFPSPASSASSSSSTASFEVATPADLCAADAMDTSGAHDSGFCSEASSPQSDEAASGQSRAQVRARGRRMLPASRVDDASGGLQRKSSRLQDSILMSPGLVSEPPSPSPTEPMSATSARGHPLAVQDELQQQQQGQRRRKGVAKRITTTDTVVANTGGTKDPAKVKSLFYVKEGLYAKTAAASRAPVVGPPSMPLPMNYGADLLDWEHDFQLPYDIHWKFKENKLAPRVLQPTSYTKIRSNIYVDVKKAKCPVESECDCSAEDACGTSCLNRLMFVECVRSSCKNFDKCRNRQFQRHQWCKSLEVFQTENAGFGLRPKKPIAKGDFIIEYVGEVVSDRERERRMWNEYKDNQNHYFLELDKDRLIDACKFGSDARFVNHSCDPNCHVEKWNVNGELRVGIFASRAISAKEELSYDYRFETFGTVMQACTCGGPSCSGLIGLKLKEGETPEDKMRLKNRPMQKVLIDFSARDKAALGDAIESRRDASGTLVPLRPFEQAESLKSHILLVRNVRKACLRIASEESRRLQKLARELRLPLRTSPSAENPLSLALNFRMRKDGRLDLIQSWHAPASSKATGESSRSWGEEALDTLPSYPALTCSSPGLSLAAGLKSVGELEKLARAAVDLHCMDSLMDCVQRLPVPQPGLGETSMLTLLGAARLSVAPETTDASGGFFQKTRQCATFGRFYRALARLVQGGSVRSFVELEQEFLLAFERHTAAQTHKDDVQPMVGANADTPVAPELVERCRELVRQEFERLKSEYSGCFVTDEAAGPSLRAGSRKKTLVERPGGKRGGRRTPERTIESVVQRLLFPGEFN